VSLAATSGSVFSLASSYTLFDGSLAEAEAEAAAASAT